jgi:hypothetical protein
MGCVETPKLEGLACGPDAPCPEGLLCGGDRRCHKPCATTADCGEGKECAQNLCREISAKECDTPGDCVSPGLCQVRDDRVACTEGRCVYGARTCDDPPSDECVAGDSRYRSYSAIGSCDGASGECGYQPVEIECAECSTTCLGKCLGIKCNDTGGGCRSEGRCVPGDPPSCAYSNLPDGTTCARGVCREGECVECAQDGHCNDGDPCTQDVCDAETNTCVHVALDDVPCSDENACTRTDTCVAGRCVGGDAVVCGSPPSSECIAGDTKYRSYSGIGACDPATGACSYAPMEVDCPSCATSCLAPCQGVVCNQANGGCRREGRCSGGSCAYVSAPDGAGCELSGDTRGVCSGGECVGCLQDVHCDDGNPCTQDTCEVSTTTCVHRPLSAGGCTDGDACTQIDTCQNGVCVGTMPVDCSTAPGQCFMAPGVCDPADGSCIFEPRPSGAPCDDQNACTMGDSCVAGDCVGSAMLACDDMNTCTDDTCDPAVGCRYTNNTAPCDDQNACTIAETCSGGECVPSSSLNCNDGNPCTIDGCDPVGGCTRASEMDGAACMFMGGGSGTCSMGACVGCTSPADCNDGNLCTTDECVNNTCRYTNNTSACSDGDACTYGDRCSAGACRGTAITCNSNTCVTRSCNGTASCSQTFHSGRGCADDGNSCTDDVCNGSGTCTHPARTNGSSCGSTAANRCCQGACVNIATNETHCGGCNSTCASGLSCESVASTTQCTSAPSSVSGRCRCNGSNAQCPRNQICRTVTPYNNRCAPLSASNCATDERVISLSGCPDYCRY